jgi:hypothetical protein
VGQRGLRQIRGRGNGGYRGEGGAVIILRHTHLLPPIPDFRPPDYDLNMYPM